MQIGLGGPTGLEMCDINALITIITVPTLFVPAVSPAVVKHVPHQVGVACSVFRSASKCLYKHLLIVVNKEIEL